MAIMWYNGSILFGAGGGPIGFEEACCCAWPDCWPCGTCCYSENSIIRGSWQLLTDPPDYTYDGHLMPQGAKDMWEVYRTGTFDNWTWYGSPRFSWHDGTEQNEARPRCDDQWDLRVLVDDGAFAIGFGSYNFPITVGCCGGTGDTGYGEIVHVMYEGTNYGCYGDVRWTFEVYNNRCCTLSTTPPAWSAATVYAKWEVVERGGNYYQSTQDNNQGHDPATASIDWWIAIWLCAARPTDTCVNGGVCSEEDI